MEDVNLRAMLTLKKEFGMRVGYSDHTKGIEVPIAAAALGAEIIEKHFTLDKNMEGPDHKASVTPDELRQLVSDIRRAETYLGDEVKIPTCSEQMTRRSLQKYLVARREIKKGERFTEDNLTAKRTDGTGISALYFDDVTGNVARRDFRTDEIIELG